MSIHHFFTSQVCWSKVPGRSPVQ